MICNLCTEDGVVVTHMVGELCPYGNFVGRPGNEDHEEEERAELRSVRRVVRPWPSCCSNVQWVVLFRSHSMDSSGGFRVDPHWTIALREGIVDEGGPIEGVSGPKFCPFCGEALPKVRLKDDPPEPLATVSDGNYCGTCNRRHYDCACFPTEAAYEVED